MPHILGGAPQGGALSREERLDKLLTSQAFGGAEVQPDVDRKQASTPHGARSASLSATPQRLAESRRPRSVTSASSTRRNTTEGTSHARTPSAQGRPRSTGSNIHTLSSSSGDGNVHGSRLHNTTEAYRQHRGTTARTVEQVGRATMTAEKAAAVDAAREKVLGAPCEQGARAAATRQVAQPPAAPRRPPRPSSRGHRLGVAN
mmetsp:Transcript_43806/g.103567  ORF Transcript_43806/g.103567 Transcript_43806/m.103567 type:complete len:203 (-) Transcript_43806:146-754(-)